jgi:hypothetical protein
MDVNLIWLFLYTSVYNTGLANGVKIRTTIFRVSRKHQDLRKCAMEILNNVRKLHRILLTQLNYFSKYYYLLIVLPFVSKYFVKT